MWQISAMCGIVMTRFKISKFGSYVFPIHGNYNDTNLNNLSFIKASLSEKFYDIVFKTMKLG